MDNKGQLISVDNNTIRLQKVQHNLERCGVENCLLVRKDVLYLSDLGIQFDRILLDAPCSGNYVIDDGWFEKRSIAGVEENARLQKQLILAAFDCLKPGGVLVYATCSLEREEDEDVVEHLLSQRKSASVENIDFPLGSSGLTPAAAGTLRMWPTQTGTQGFYVAKIRKA
jgi:16S rRNA C967 or C1407 C5-methylase (RsmB/RsmF family)